MARNAFTLGKIFGISINIDASWLVIFLLVSWNLAAGVFPVVHPEWNTALNWMLGIAASILFFSSVLAHELAHSLVAKASGLPITSITLFLFGGIANLAKEPDSPKTEFWMVIAGPITSVILGATFLAAGLFMAEPLLSTYNDPMRIISSLDPASTVLLWLGPVNILLAVFNLIPGYPLDGGRILRSAIWAVSKNLVLATKYASIAGQAVAWTFIFAGILMIIGIPVPLLGVGLFSGVWIILVGWFLRNAAIASYLQILAENILKEVKVSDLMQKNLIFAPPDLTVKQAVDEFLAGSTNKNIIIAKNKKPQGVVRGQDVAKLSGQNNGKKKIGQIMTRLAQTDQISPAEKASKAMETLITLGKAYLPVFERGKFIGLLDKEDIIIWLKMNLKKDISF